MAFTFTGPFGGHALYECRDTSPCLHGDTRWLADYAERRLPAATHRIALSVAATVPAEPPAIEKYVTARSLVGA